MPTLSRLYEFTMQTIDGDQKALSDYRGTVLMIVNVASRCGFTPQYEQLERVFESFRSRGFMILGFPANNFLSQEPGSDAEIKDFCEERYRVRFDLFSKISVKGSDQHAFYRYLTTDTPFKGSVKWNFQKYLVDRHGNVVARFLPSTKPDDPEVIRSIESLLRQE